MRGVKLDERILRHFRMAVFIGVRKSDEGVYTAFFIDGKAAQPSDIGALIAGLQAVPPQLNKAYQESLRVSSKSKKRRRRKKNET